MPEMRHPILKGSYRRRDDGLVDVTAAGGISGIFDHDGRWISGELRIADPALCYWIAKANSATRPGNLGG